MDGCFDMMHYGHANALRQVRPVHAPRAGTALITKRASWCTHMQHAAAQAA